MVNEMFTMGATTTLVIVVALYLAFRAGFMHARRLYLLCGAKAITDYAPPLGLERRDDATTRAIWLSPDEAAK